MSLNDIMIPTFVGICGIYICGVSLMIGRVWAERGFRAEREKYRKDREEFEIERAAARRLLADLKANQRGLHEHPFNQRDRQGVGGAARSTAQIIEYGVRRRH